MKMTHQTRGKVHCWRGMQCWSCSHSHHQRSCSSDPELESSCTRSRPRRRCRPGGGAPWRGWPPEPGEWKRWDTPRVRGAWVPRPLLREYCLCSRTLGTSPSAPPCSSQLHLHQCLQPQQCHCQQLFSSSRNYHLFLRVQDKLPNRRSQWKWKLNYH